MTYKEKEPVIVIAEGGRRLLTWRRRSLIPLDFSDSLKSPKKLGMDWDLIRTWNLDYGLSFL